MIQPRVSPRGGLTRGFIVAVGPLIPIGYNTYTPNALETGRFLLLKGDENRRMKPQNKVSCDGFFLAGSRFLPSKQAMFSYCLSVR